MATTIKKERWERKFDEFSSGKMSQEIDTLTNELEELRGNQEGAKFSDYKDNLSKIEGLKAKISEKKEKHLAIEKNKDKIANIIELKNELVEKTVELITEIEGIETIGKEKRRLEIELAKLNFERENLGKEISQLDKELKNPNLSDEEKAKKQAERQEKIKKAEENDAKYVENINLKQEKEGQLGKVANLDNLKEQKLKNEQLIAKCDLIGANLIKGKSMEDIKAKLTNFKFKPNKDFSEKIKAIREMRKAEKVKTVEEVQPQKEEKAPEEKVVAAEPKKEEPKVFEDISSTSTELVELKGINKFIKNHPKLEAFLQKHPRIENIVRKANDFFTKNKKEEKAEITTSQPEQIENKKPEIKEEPKVEAKVEAIVEQKEEVKPVQTAAPQKTENYDWIMRKMEKMGDDEVLTQIADKGTNGFKEGLRAAAYTQLAQNKATAAQNDVINHQPHQNNEQSQENEGEEIGG